MFNSAGDDSTILLDDDRIDRHSDCIKTGILIKRGQKYKSLKKRYFVLLQDGFLFYYKDKVDLDHPLGIIYLKSNAFLNKNAEISETVGFGFTIRAGSKRFLLAAESSEEKASWCRAIDKVITCCASREKALIQQQQRKRSQVVMSSSPTNVSAMNGTNVFDVSNNKSQQQQQQPLSPTSSSSNTGGFVNEGSENGNQFQGNNTSLSTAPTTSGSYTSGNSTTLNGYEREKFEKLQRQKDEALNLLQQIDVTFVKLLSTTNLLKKEIQQGLEKIKPQSSEETQQNEHAQSSSEPHKKNQKAPQTSSSEDDSDTGFDTSDSEETDIRTSFDPTVILAPSTVSDLMNPVERLKGLKMTMDKVSNELSSLFEKLQFKNSSADETTKQLEETIEELEQENQELKQKVQDLETENAELTHHKRLLIKEVKKYRNEAVSTGSPPQQQQPSQQEEPRPQE
ncbi:hypothetical protein C9374_006432 [Naegleria lovaniensis]|uniref:PH domain-containing protein n=1 Tax=Naegleria lovaniensis TaxID=51637 RepID=A0AA88GMT8_NAELO|nr:uncharacterized protein C9374_006432 [Naegleria lovaniensis]KAG2381443.1 hypothetical protein C9374_006432 [Naegleria lovaniensis]